MPSARVVEVLTEEKLDHIADAINGATEVRPFAVDLDVRFFYVPPVAGRPLAPVGALHS